MKKILNLNITFKMLILIIYCLILLTLSGIIVGAVLSEDETKGYSPVARDQYISVVARITETRKEVSEKEKADWIISYQIAQQNPDVKIQNVRIFTEAKTMDDKTIYFEGSKKESSSVKQEVNTTKNAFSTYTSISKSYSSSKKTNSELKLVYTKVLYQVVENEIVQNKELKYRFVPCKPENINFDNFIALNEQLNYNENITTLNITDSNKYLTLNVKYNETGENTAEKPLEDLIEIYIQANEAAISVANLSATNVSVTVFGRVENQKTDPDNFFSEYITLIDLHGCLVDLNSENQKEDIKNNLTKFYASESKISKEYNISELYITFTLTTDNGATTTINNKITLNK